MPTARTRREARYSVRESAGKGLFSGTDGFSSTPNPGLSNSAILIEPSFGTGSPCSRGSNIGTTAVCGRKPSSAQKKLIEDTVGAMDAIMDTVRPGVTPRQAGIVGDEYAAKHGYDDSGGALWDLFGHGLSTFWNGPIIPSHGAKDFKDDRLYWNVDEPFHENQVYTVECFFREEGLGTATFEEIFIIKEDGLERLSQTPMIFW